jgi:hypothetical protein
VQQLRQLQERISSRVPASATTPTAEEEEEEVEELWLLPPPLSTI